MPSKVKPEDVHIRNLARIFKVAHAGICLGVLTEHRQQFVGGSESSPQRWTAWNQPINASLRNAHLRQATRLRRG